MIFAELIDAGVIKKEELHIIALRFHSPIFYLIQKYDMCPEKEGRKYHMTLKDISNGPSWIIWIVFVIFVILSAILLFGHGANLIAGYNTSSKEEKAKYNEKKVCQVTGAGMMVITVLILV